MWWIAVICSEDPKDYYTLYKGFEIVQARSPEMAIKRALKKHSSNAFVYDVFGPFKEKPARWKAEVKKGQ